MKIRFIAGVVCPKCGAEDSVRIHIAEAGEVDEQLRDCVTCGYEERLGFGVTARQEVPTRVNQSSKPNPIQDVEPQTLKLQ